MSNGISGKSSFNIKDKFVRFWRCEKGKMSLIRDVAIALILVLILLTALWAYTGQWWGAPMVAIESGSMTHPNEPFGRLGTIDAGDMVLLVKVNSRTDVVTRGSKDHGTLHRQDKNYLFYGDYGDVIIYHPYGYTGGEQIIHRAMCWVEYNEDGTYTVVDYGILNEDSVTIPELGLDKWTHPIQRPDGTPITPHSGFFTKGDNNTICDQKSPDLCTEPVRVEWISGKARQEIPWIGTINLFFNDLTSGEEPTVKNVEGDSITCLIILIVILISIPISLDVYDYYKTQKKQSVRDILKKKSYTQKEKQEFPEEDNKNEE